MGEGNVFSLFTPGGGYPGQVQTRGYPSQVQLGGGTQSGPDGRGVPSQVQMGGGVPSQVQPGEGGTSARSVCDNGLSKQLAVGITVETIHVSGFQAKLTKIDEIKFLIFLFFLVFLFGPRSILWSH